MALTPQLTRLTNNQRLGLAIGQARVKPGKKVKSPFEALFGGFDLRRDDGQASR
jgi:hypothetical protein